MAPPASEKSSNEALRPDEVGEFEAELVESLPAHRSRKMVKLAHPQAEGAELPEHGTWHYQRKRAILKKYPQVKELFGYNPFTALIIIGLFFLHTSLAILSSYLPWYLVFPMIYSIGALNSFQIGLLGHEGTHGLIFNPKSPNGRLFNRLITFVAFLPVFMGPFASFWMVEHMWHHNVVVDKCIRFGKQTNALWKKILICLIVIPLLHFGMFISGMGLLFACVLHYAKYLQGKTDKPFPSSFPLRPYKSFPQLINAWTLFDIVSKCVFWGTLYYYFGLTPIAYFFLSTCFANGLHPLGGRMVAEHYVYNKNQPTYSVYNPWSPLTLNIGHHVEHHDFANIPWNRLPKLTKMAPEFYLKESGLYSYPDYISVMKEFFTNPGIPAEMFFEEQPMLAENNE